MLYTVKETAQILSLDKNAVYALIGAGLLTPLKIKTYKIAASELEQFIAKWQGWDLSDPACPREIRCS